MKKLIVTIASAGLLCACGMGVEPAPSDSAAQKDPLLALDGSLGERVRLAGIGRGELCNTELVRPTAQGTVQSVPKLGIFGVAPVGSEVQSSYYRSNGVNEEYRRGIAEFYVPGGADAAVLHFREHRGWTSEPLPADTHLIEVYPGNLELEIDDFDARAALAGRFETDPNLEPSFSNAYDVTKALQEIGPKFGVRFQLEGGSGSGTSFMDLSLEVTRCRPMTRFAN